MRKFLLALVIIFVAGLICQAKNIESPIRVYQLANGHKVIIKEIHSNPIVTIDTWVKTGTADETPEINGISHFLEHLMFKGTKTHKNGEIEKKLESLGARCNAATSKDFTHYYVTIASEYVDTALKLHADMMQNPAIPADEMEKERRVVQEEIRRADDSPQRIIFNNLFRMMFREHPYRMDTLGPHKVIENLSREEIFDYYNKRYIPSSLATVVVGDVDTEEVLTLMKENFNKKYAPTSSPARRKKEPEPQESSYKEIRGDYQSGYAFWGFRGVPASSIKESYALDLAASILGGSRSSRLYQKLKEEQGLVTSIGASHYSLKDDSVFIVSADFEPEKLQLVKKAIMDEVTRLSLTPVTDEELERAKTLDKRGFIYGNESVENIANSLGHCETLNGNIDNYKNHIQYIENVSANDIQRVAQQYLEPQRLALAVLLPEETMVNTVTSDKKTIETSTRSILSNGSTLITNYNPANDIVAMSVFFKGGGFLEPVPGTARILTDTMLYGTKKRSYQELIKEIEDLGISISPGSSSDYFEISLKSTKEDFDRAFEILADIIKNSTFEEKYIEKNKNDLLVEIKKTHDSPVSIASENFIEELYKDHPYGHIGAVLEQSIPEITRNDIVNYQNRVFIPENMIVSVAGNVEHDYIAHKLAAIFPASGQKPPLANYNDNFTPLKEKKQVFTPKDSNAAWVFMGWPVANITDNKEFATFRVIDAVLSDGLSSRLHRSFREEQGLAYRVGSSYSPKLDRGHFVLYIGTNPDNLELVKSKLLDEIRRLKTEPVPAEELLNSKNKFIGNYALSQETNQNKARLSGVFEVVDKGFGFNYDFPELIRQVTSEDIIKTARKYFDNPYIISVAAPENKK